MTTKRPAKAFTSFQEVMQDVESFDRPLYLLTSVRTDTLLKLLDDEVFIRASSPAQAARALADMLIGCCPDDQAAPPILLLRVGAGAIRNRIQQELAEWRAAQGQAEQDDPVTGE